MSDLLLPIDQISRLSGMPSSTIRYYERCGLIDNVDKMGGRRHYSPSILQQLSVIRTCQSLGFSLAEIRDLLRGPLGLNGAWRELALRRRQQFQDQIQRLKKLVDRLDATLTCECREISDCLSRCAEGQPSEEAPEHAAGAAGWQHRPRRRTRGACGQAVGRAG
jgi:MerR family redox-sensitive transcriptional activator SoxR